MALTSFCHSNLQVLTFSSKNRIAQRNTPNSSIRNPIMIHESDRFARSPRSSVPVETIFSAGHRYIFARVRWHAGHPVLAEGMRRQVSLAGKSYIIPSVSDVYMHAARIYSGDIHAGVLRAGTQRNNARIGREQLPSRLTNDIKGFADSEEAAPRTKEERASGFLLAKNRNVDRSSRALRLRPSLVSSIETCLTDVPLPRRFIWPLKIPWESVPKNSAPRRESLSYPLWRCAFTSALHPPAYSPEISFSSRRHKRQSRFSRVTVGDPSADPEFPFHRLCPSL